MKAEPNGEAGWWKTGLYFFGTLLVVLPITIAAERLLNWLSIDNELVVVPIGLAGISFMFWALSPKNPAQHTGPLAGYGLEKDAGIGHALLVSAVFAVVGLALFGITAVLIRYPAILNFLAFVPAMYLTARLTKLLYGRLRRRPSAG